MKIEVGTNNEKVIVDGALWTTVDGNLNICENSKVVATFRDWNYVRAVEDVYAIPSDDTVTIQIAGHKVTGPYHLMEKSILQAKQMRMQELEKKK